MDKILDNIDLKKKSLTSFILRFIVLSKLVIFIPKFEFIQKKLKK